MLLWLHSGDLGIELSPVEVPICQKLIIEESNKTKENPLLLLRKCWNL